MNDTRIIVWTSVFICAVLALPADAATRRVCASGCDYVGLQQAIDAAAAGDTILLRAGETFTGNFILRKKSGTADIIIRSDAADANLPAAGKRLVPSTRSGGTTSTSLLARLRGVGGQYRTTPVISTETGAHNYRLQFLDIDGVAQEGWETLIQLGNNVGQTSTSLAPYNLVFDRVYIHGHPTRGQKRCVALDSAATSIINSYLADCRHFSTDSQAIAGFNGPGPFLIENNYIEGSTENILFGGSDPKTPNLVPSDITIRRNYITKPTAWKKVILTPPANPRVSTTSTKGSLSAGRHYFKVEAVMASGGAYAFSLPSAEVSIDLPSSSSSVSLTWSGVSGATQYRVYRGTAAGGESAWLETTGTSLVYTGSSEKSAKPHTAATVWNIKNLIELKNARRVLIEANIIENVWMAQQNGYAIVLTPRNQDNTAPWTAVQDITLRYNTVRHANGGINLLGYDYSSPGGSQRTTRITVQHNIFDDIGGSWGGTGHWVLITQSPTSVTLDHNTVFQTGDIVLIDDGASNGFVFTNNTAPHNTYGIFGVNSSPGNGTLSKYFPSAVFRRNVIGGAKASQYPTDNFYPTLTDFLAQFVNRALGDFRLVAGSPYLTAATDGLAIGVNVTALQSAQQGAAGDSGGSGNVAPTALANGPYTGVVGQGLAVSSAGSKDSDGSIASYAWSWGDGTANGSGATASHTYTKTGTFTITLTVTDNSGATGSATATATIGSSTTGNGGGGGTTGAGDIVLTAASFAGLHGHWARVSSSGSPGGQALQALEHGWWSATPLARPTHYVEATFQPVPDVPYRVWLRMSGRSTSDDSVYVQFTGAVNGQGQPLWRVGTTNALTVDLENCDGCGISGWGWQRGAWWQAVPSTMRFAAGPQTIRIQTREDGVKIDQVVLSPASYLSSAPGSATNDGTVFQATSFTADPKTVVLRAGDATERRGNWTVDTDSTAAGGTRLGSADKGWWSATPAASPADYVDFTFTAVAGVKYRTWLRMSATGNSKANDSVFVQYSGASGGANRIGSTTALIVNRERCEGCGMTNWGWVDAAWWLGQTGELTFASTGVQTIRIQTREDGVRLDQIVISPTTYLANRPGAVDNDTTIVPR